MRPIRNFDPGVADPDVVAYPFCREPETRDDADEQLAAAVRIWGKWERGEIDSERREALLGSIEEGYR